MTDGLTELLTSLVDRAVRTAVSEALAESMAAGAGPLTYRTSSAADVLDVSQDTIGRLLDAGELEYVEGVGQGRLVTRESLVALVERRRERVGVARSSGPRVRPSRRPREAAA